MSYAKSTKGDKMYYVQNELTVSYDVDSTLVFNDTAGSLVIDDPFEKGKKIHLRPHRRHIKQLMNHKARGFHVTVWSQQGALWAKTIVEALELGAYVDVVITKPTCYVDDLPGDQILGTRIYLTEKE